MNSGRINGCCSYCGNYTNHTSWCRLNPTNIVKPGPLTPTGEAAHRKARPLCTGVLDYFPDALLEVAHCSKVGNDQHNPGQPLHWAKEKSTDEADALARHLLERGTLDTDGVRHSAKVAWRALAMLQREIDAERVGPLFIPSSVAPFVGEFGSGAVIKLS